MEYTKKCINAKSEDLAELFGVLANPIRLQILKLLIDSCAENNNHGLCVRELNARIDVPQPYLSKHLKILESNGVLVHRREANRMYYAFAPNSSICRIFDFLGSCCAKYSEFTTWKQKTKPEQTRKTT